MNAKKVQTKVLREGQEPATSFPTTLIEMKIVVDFWKAVWNTVSGTVARAAPEPASIPLTNPGIPQMH